VTYRDNSYLSPAASRLIALFGAVQDHDSKLRRWPGIHSAARSLLHSILLCECDPEASQIRTRSEQKPSQKWTERDAEV